MIIREFLTWFENSFPVKWQSIITIVSFRFVAVAFFYWVLLKSKFNQWLLLFFSYLHFYSFCCNISFLWWRNNIAFGACCWLWAIRFCFDQTGHCAIIEIRRQQLAQGSLHQLYRLFDCVFCSATRLTDLFGCALVSSYQVCGQVDGSSSQWVWTSAR